MSATLTQIGIPPNHLMKILALYQKPTARVIVNGIRFSLITVKNVTRQAYPLSPIQYILAMEHLANAIRQNQSI